jgi:hypothetical protein
MNYLDLIIIFISTKYASTLIWPKKWFGKIIKKIYKLNGTILDSQECFQ